MSSAPTEIRWRKLCQLAMFEADRNLVSGRITDARTAIANRESLGGLLSEESRALQLASRKLDELESKHLP